MRSNYSNLAKTYTSNITSAAAIQTPNYNTAILYDITSDGTAAHIKDTQCGSWFNGDNPILYTTEYGQQNATCQDVPSSIDGSIHAVLSCTKEGILNSCCPGTEKDTEPAYIYKDDSQNSFFCSTSGSTPLPPPPRPIPTAAVVGWCQGINTSTMRPGLDVCRSTCADNFGNKWCYEDGLVKVSSDNEEWLGTCENIFAQDPYIDYCSMPLPPGAFKDPVTNTNGGWGCPNTEAFKNVLSLYDNLSNNSSNENQVKNYCYYNDNCKGYYANDDGAGNKSYIASYDLFGDCPKASIQSPNYSHFVEKNTPR